MSERGIGARRTMIEMRDHFGIPDHIKFSVEMGGD
jgi:hypothetical protein